ncbi:MAG: parallel beta-helix domain-containing protein [Pseudomonadota bacterium]
MIRISIAAALLASAAPAWAETHTISPGEGAQERLQEALILAEPGDTVELEAGRYILTDGLSLDVDGVTVRGAGMDGTVLDFTTQEGSGEGLLVTSDNVTLRDFALENPKGDGIKSKGADQIVYYRIRVTWTNGPDAGNGAYGIYPVESTGVLVDGAKVTGASDAGIYVGQSNQITVRNSIAEANVAGIEIENSRNALVEHNIAIRNTGGILVFDLPGLPVMNGGNVIVANNLVVANDTANFAPPGNIVAGVRRGTGIMVMANEKVLIENNILDENPTAPIMVIAYTEDFNDERYNPLARDIVIGENRYGQGGDDPQLAGAEPLVAAFGGSLPPLMWDGLGSVYAVAGTAGWTLNLTEAGGGMAAARPTRLTAPEPTGEFDRSGIGAPDELDDRI